MAVGSIKFTSATGLFFGAWLALLGTVLYLLVQPAADDDDGGVKIGRIVKLKGQVRARPSDSLLWSDLTKDQPLHDGDLLATGDAASADLRLIGGKGVQLGPNSLISLTVAESTAATPERQLEMKLLHGEVTARTEKVAPPSRHSLLRVLHEMGVPAAQPPRPLALEINSGKNKFALSAQDGAKLDLAKTADKTEIVNVSGEVKTLAEDGTSQKLSTEDIVSRPQPITPPKAPAKVPVASIQEPAAAKLPDIVFAPPPLPTPPPATVPAPIRHVTPVKLAVAKPLVPILMAPKPLPPESWLPRIANGQDQALFTADSLVPGCPAHDLPIILDAPTIPQGHSDWTPFIDIQPIAAASVKIRVLGTASYSRQTLSIPMLKVCDSLVVGSGVPAFGLHLRFGALLGKGLKEVVAPQVARIMIASLRNWPDLPVTVHFNKATLQPLSPGTWLRSQVLSGGSAVRLRSATLLPKLIPLFAANGFVAIDERAVASSSTVVQFFALGKLTATLGTTDLDRAFVRSLAQLLGADTAFVGDVGALVNLPTGRIDRLSALDHLLHGGTNLRLISRQRVIEVDNASVQSNAAALNALAPSANTAITKDVEIIGPQPDEDAATAAAGPGK